MEEYEEDQKRKRAKVADDRKAVAEEQRTQQYDNFFNTRQKMLDEV